MAEAAILKNPQIAISGQRFDRSAQHLTRLRILAFRAGPALKITNFKKFKMTDSRHIEKSKNVVSMDIINSLLKTGNKTAHINVKKLRFLNTLLTDRKQQKS